MNYIVNAETMKNADKATIEEHGIPSLVLMERAALSVVDTMISEGLLNVTNNKLTHKTADTFKALEQGTHSHLNGYTVVVCGTGNNAADGVAVARMLHLKNERCAVILVGDSDRHSKELTCQISSAVSYGVPFYEFSVNKEKCFELIKNAENIVDAIFGIGLKRNVEGDFAEIINTVNESHAKVISVDVPSGYNTDTGVCLLAGVKADITVCFSYLKKGLLLSDCYLNSGKVVVTDVGIYIDSTINVENNCCLNTDLQYCTSSYSEENQSIRKVTAKDEESGETKSNINVVCKLTENDLSLIPAKHASANKGSNAKLLIIAGSEEIYGACYLSAFAALRTGSGYVKIFTHKNNIKTLQDKLPEAVCISYDESLLNLDLLTDAMNFADAILIGPGLATGELSKKILEFVIEKSNKPLIIDADGINLLAGNAHLLEAVSKRCRTQKNEICRNNNLLTENKIPVIITPHLAEMSRLTGIPVKDINHSMEDVAVSFSKEYGVITVLKNYVTLITDGNTVYINTSGNEALATAGSGDVLAGIITAYSGMKMDCLKAAALGTYVHGRAGSIVSEKMGTKNLIASDIISGIINV